MEWNGLKNMKCEHCTNDIAHVNVSHSAVAVLQYVNTSGYKFFQCEEGQAHNNAHWQHFHCSHACMKKHMEHCIGSHYTEEQLHPIPVGGGTTTLHKLVLGNSLTCKECDTPLTDKAYRFCLTHATPSNSVPDESLNDLGEWCCSLEHARNRTLVHIQKEIST